MYIIIKWIGTIIIISIGVFVAYKYTSGTNISKQTVYKIELPGQDYALSDGHKVFLQISIVFSKKENAKNIANKEEEINKFFSEFFIQVDSNLFASLEGLIKVKAGMLMVLSKNFTTPLFIEFNTRPKIY